MRLFAMRDFGEAVLRSKSDSLIREVYEKRKEALKRKAINRSRELNRLEKRSLRKDSVENVAVALRIKYGEEDIEQYLQLCDMLTGYAVKVFGTSERETKHIRKKMMNGADFYKTYDPLG